ncbi:hypothetical protein Tco_0318712 [Tanacetum coccineum]
MLIRGVNLLNSKLETECYLRACWTGGLSAEVTPGAKLCPRHVSCVEPQEMLGEPDVQVPLDEIEIDENLRFVEEPIEIVETRCGKIKAQDEFH